MVVASPCQQHRQQPLHLAAAEPPRCVHLEMPCAGESSPTAAAAPRDASSMCQPLEQYMCCKGEVAHRKLQHSKLRQYLIANRQKYAQEVVCPCHLALILPKANECLWVATIYHDVRSVEPHLVSGIHSSPRAQQLLHHLLVPSPSCPVQGILSTLQQASPRGGR
jgi:hypothetical protein